MVVVVMAAAVVAVVVVVMVLLKDEIVVNMAVGPLVIDVRVGVMIESLSAAVTVVLSILEFAAPVPYL